MNFVQNRQKNTISMISNNSADCENGTSSSGGDDHQLQVPPLLPEIFDIELLEKKSVEDLLNGSHDAAISLTQTLSFTSGSILQSSPIPLRRSPVPSNISPNNSPKPTHSNRNEIISINAGSSSSSSSSSTTTTTASITTTTSTTTTTASTASATVTSASTSTSSSSTTTTSTASASASTAAAAIAIIKDVDQYLGNFYSDTTEDSQSKSSESSNLATSGDGAKLSATDVPDRPKSSKLSERAKKKSWYNVLYPSYKSRSEDFKKLFKGVPDDERLVVDYSCAVQRDILVHGRLYVSQNYLCFYANIFRWETCLCIKWKDVTAITKEKTARVIPNAILVSTVNEKHFVTSFTSRDKAYLMLFRVWQNALMGKPMQPQEMWQWSSYKRRTSNRMQLKNVHNCYGDELGLTSDDEDYIDPNETKDDDSQHLFFGNSNKSATESVSEEYSEAQSDTMSTSSKLMRDEPCTIQTAMVTAATAPIIINDLLKSSSEQHQQQKMNQQQQQKLISGVGVGHRKIIRKRDDNILTISEQLPTDMSDSSDSENGKNIPFISTAECNSMHEGRQLVHTILPINVDTLLSLLFSKSKFLSDFHNNRKTTNMIHTDWIYNEESLKTRTVTLTVALTQAVGPKCSHVTENQVMRECSVDGQLYSIDITSTNAGIPYADSFYVFMHYCLVRTVDNHTMFSVHAQIKYKKSVWGVVKGFIEKNAWAGLEDFYTALLRALQSEYCIPPAKSKGRRPRRTSTLQRNVQPHEEPINILKIPPIAFTTRPTPLAIKLPKVPSTRYESLFWFVIVLLISLILLNVILYFKLWTLENASHHKDERLPDFTMLKNAPTTQEDWIHLMQHQETLHANEMIRWQRILQVAIDMLRKTEKTLNDLLTLIHTTSEHHSTEHSHIEPITVSENLPNQGAFTKEL